MSPPLLAFSKLIYNKDKAYSRKNRRHDRCDLRWPRESVVIVSGLRCRRWSGCGRRSGGGRRARRSSECARDGVGRALLRSRRCGRARTSIWALSGDDFDGWFRTTVVGDYFAKSWCQIDRIRASATRSTEQRY